MFNRVLCGVDESPESRVAVRQAARVTGPRAHLVLAAVADLGPVIQAGWSATAVSDEIVGEAQAALAAAQAEAPMLKPSCSRALPEIFFFAPRWSNRQTSSWSEPMGGPAPAESCSEASRR